MVDNSWEFWHEVFLKLVLIAKKEGVDITGGGEEPMGFKVKPTRPEPAEPLVLEGLMYPEAYKYYLSGGRVRLSSSIIENDLAKISKIFRELGYVGFVLILDEAHILLSVREIQQEIRNVIQRTENCGLVFAGETALATMFIDPSEPFFGQATVIPLGNFPRCSRKWI